MWKYLLSWVPMVPIAIINALIREELLARYLSELHAHQVSTFTGVILFGIYIWLLFRVWEIGSGRRAITVGLVWLVLTVSFEFIFGHFVVGHPWSRLFSDYNISAGRVWVIIPIWITAAPYLFYRLRKLTGPVESG